MKTHTLNAAPSLMKLLVLVLMTTWLNACAISTPWSHKEEQTTQPITAVHETIELTASDGTTIKQYLFTSATVPKATIFVLPEHGALVSDIYPSFESLTSNGFQVLTMDYRARGETELEIPHVSIVSDVVNAIDYLKSKDNGRDRPVVLLGQGYGAQPAIYAAHIKYAAVAGLVLEGAFTSFSEQAEFSNDSFLASLIGNFVPNVYSGVELIQHIKLPTLIIHSTEDQIVPYRMGEELKSASGSSVSQLWQIDGPHLSGLSTKSEEYINKINYLLSIKEIVI